MCLLVFVSVSCVVCFFSHFIPCFNTQIGECAPNLVLFVAANYNHVQFAAQQLSDANTTSG